MTGGFPALLAAGSAALVVALCLPAVSAPPRLRQAVPEPGRHPWVLLLTPAGLGAWLLGLPAWVGVPVGICTCAAAALWTLWTRRARRVRRRVTDGVLLEACQQLASELRSGQPPGAALDHAAEVWPVLARVAESFRFGADVPGAIRQVAAQAGATDLRLLAAAWQLAQATGQSLAAPIERVVDQLVAARATRRVVDGELASARATARLVALLPLVALAMGAGTGGQPVAFLLGTPAGWSCLAVGLGLGVAGLWWIEAIAGDVERGL